MDTTQQKDLWAIVMSIVDRNILKLSFANEVFDSIRDRMKGILDNPEKLIEFLCQHLKPKEFERQDNGEVFTPPSLINEKFDKLTEAYPEVWSNPNLKFLDPANGIGNYPALAYGRLMVGLANAFPDATQRKKHILENMLYMCELEPKNVEVSRKLFDENGEYNLNLFQGSFFDLNPLKEWGIEKFDIIMGNPPYNSGGIRSSTGKKLTKGKKSETIWPKFVDISLNILNEGGYLVFIHPTAWLKHSNIIHERLLKKHIVWMMLWDDSKSKSSISADIPLSIYILHNRDNDAKEVTRITSQLSRQKINTTSLIYLNMEYSLPMGFYTIFDKITKKLEKHPDIKLNIKHNTVQSVGTGMPLPVEYCDTDMLGVDTHRLKDGIIVKKMKKPHPDMLLPKLILSNKRDIVGAFIDDGRLGLVGTDKFYILGDDLDVLYDLFQTKLASFIVKNVKFRQSFIERDAIAYIPDVRKISEDELPEITDDCLNKYFGFTDEEVAMIQTL